MKNFRFNLSTVLQVRSETENAAHRELLKAQIHLQEMFHRLSQLENEYYRLVEGFNRMQKEKFSSEEMGLYYQCFYRVEHQISLQIEDVVKAQNRVEDKRQLVVKAMQQKKILENLKNKKMTDWQTEWQKREMTFFDEVSTTQYTRKEDKE